VPAPGLGNSPKRAGKETSTGGGGTGALDAVLRRPLLSPWSGERWVGLFFIFISLDLCLKSGFLNKNVCLSSTTLYSLISTFHYVPFDVSPFSLFSILLPPIFQKCAQVLLTLDNLANRSQYLNALSTFRELLCYGVVPVVNENDTVAVEQLRIGDNDTLSAQVAALVGADWWVQTDGPFFSSLFSISIFLFLTRPCLCLEIALGGKT
jgi:hypothetical protein